MTVIRYEDPPGPALLQPSPDEELTGPVKDGPCFLQPRKGFRFSLDPLLLAAFCRLKPGWRVLDLGAGSGAAGVLLAWAYPQVRVTCLEIQPRLAALAWRNAWLNGLGRRVEVVQGDLRRAELFPRAGFEAVATNPPYRPLGAGRLGPDQERNQARHELTCSRADWIAAAGRWLVPGGRLFAVYPAWRLAGLLSGLEGAGLAPKRLRPVYDRPGGEGRLVLVEAVSEAGTELKLDPPFFLHHTPAGRPGPGKGKDWSKEMAALLSGRLSGAA